MKVTKFTIVLLATVNIAYGSDMMKSQYSIYDEPDLGYKQIIINDPFEKFNRSMHNFNKAFDKVLLTPITDMYDKAVPEKARVAIDNALGNLREPVSMANHALQLDLYSTLTTFWRFFFNLTFGVLGTQDFAGKYLNLPRNSNDFDNTLAKYCFARGPYLVLPILGPSTVRGGIGKTVDIVGDPLNFAFRGEDWNNTWLFSKSALNVINFRSTHKGLFEDLNKLSVDSYAMIKSVYSQKIYSRDLKYKYCK